MENNKSLYIMLGATVFLIIGGITVYSMTDAKDGTNYSTPSEYNGLAQCITDSGAKFYGAFWCGHCQDQKKAFGDAVKFLPYEECATQDGNGQTEVCSEAGITNYPTWIFGDGTQVTGNIALPTLAQATGCEMPGAE